MCLKLYDFDQVYCCNYGELAHMVERVLSMHEVRGSIPLLSTFYRLGELREEKPFLTKIFNPIEKNWPEARK